MLTQIDRVQLVVPDRAAAGAAWRVLLGAEPDAEDKLAAVAALRSRHRLGRGFVELLEPDGAGPVADALAARGPHLFAAGAATPDLEGLIARLRAGGKAPVLEGGQALLDPTHSGRGLRIVLSAEQQLDPVGDIDFLYEVTHLVDDAPAATQECADLFGLDSNSFVPISSEQYGYAGTLTLFHPDRLHRFEVIHPHEGHKTMGRFFARSGESFYMAFAESRAIAKIQERARERGAGFTAEPTTGEGGPDTLFLHPQSLGGMMLGLSGPTIAWRWSGHPERVRSAA
jgi:hypothetical protein